LFVLVADIALILAGVGFFMVGVGGLALWCLKTKNGSMLNIVLLIDVALFCLVLASAIVGCILGLDIRDPVREATIRAWGEYSVPTPKQAIWRQTFWDSRVCTNNLVETCETSFASEAFDAIASPHSNYTVSENRVRFLFADCDYARRGLQCVTADDDAVCGLANLNGDDAADVSACEATVDGTSNGCTYSPGDGADVDATCVSKPDCAAADALKHSCDNCNRECKEFAIDKAKANLLPAAHLVYGVFAFCMICAIVNDQLVGMETMEGMFRNLGLFFNGLVSLTGLALAVAAAVGQYYLSEDCPSDSSVADCSNPAVMAVCVLGVALLVVGGLALFTIIKHMEGGVSCLSLQTTNLVLLGVAFPLLFCGLFLSIVAGGLDSVNTQFDKHYPEMRKSVELKEPDYCSTTDADGEKEPMTDEDCRAKMTAALEGDILTVGMIALFTAVGMLFVMVCTLRSVRALKAESDSDGNETLNPLEEE
jgi:hypothetical protein